MKKFGHVKSCNSKCGRFELTIQSPCLRGEGDLDADIMLVGEAPGQTEDRRSRPFIGSSGKLLETILRNVGLERKNLYITNAVKCATPDENIKPKKSEIKQCREILRREINRVKPKVVGALGAVAVDALLNRTGIKTIKNTPFMSEEFGVKVIPIYHPAYALRNPAAKIDIVEGFRVLVAESEHSAEIVSLNKKKTKYLIAQSKEKIDKVLDSLEKQKVFAFDFESTSVDPIDAKILTIGFSWKPRTGVSIDWESINKKQKKRICDVLGSDRIKVAHNLKYEAEMCRVHDIPLKDPSDCTMLMHHLLDENNKHDLDTLTLVYTDMGEYWSELEKYKKEYMKNNKVKKDDFSYDMLPRRVLMEYNAKDCDATLRIYKIFKDRIKQEGLHPLYSNNVLPYLKEVILDMELRGVYCNRKKLKYLLDKYTAKEQEKLDAVANLSSVKEYEEIRKQREIDKIVEKHKKSKILKNRFPDVEDYIEKSLKYDSYRFKLRSTPQLRELLFTIPDRKPIKLTDKKAISVDEEVLLQLAEQGESIAQSIIDYRKISKFVSTYIRSTYQKTVRDSVIHASYQQHMTVSGRLSCKYPNMQNIPRDAKDFKECIVARPGYIFVKADLAQAEFRCWAHYSADEDMIADIESGLDIHRRTASEVFGVSEEEVTSEQRNAAKGCVFGLMYGRGPGAVAEQYEIPVDSAEEIKRTFFGKYPKASQWLEKQKRTAVALGYVKSWLGRIRRLPDVESENDGVVAEALRQATNSPVQSLASDMNNQYMITILRNSRAQGLSAWPVCTVHDANFIEVREEHKDQLVCIMKEVVANEFPEFKCEMKLDFEIGHDFGNLEEVNV